MLNRVLTAEATGPQGNQQDLCGIHTSSVSTSLLSCDTYSADFQKCPGWDSLRLSLGSLSSMSASWTKVGLSRRSYAQQADRISWDNTHSLVHPWRMCSSKTSVVGINDLLWPPCPSWSLPKRSLYPLRCQPARWWLQRAGSWLASPSLGAHTK